MHGRSEDDTIKLLIDSFRLRIDDEYRTARVMRPGTIYDVYSEDSGEGFKMWLDDVKSRPGLLPSWWTDEWKEECIQYGMDYDEFATLHYTIGPNDLLEHYGDDGTGVAVKQLRIFGDRVTGWSVNQGCILDAMRRIQVPKVMLDMQNPRLETYSRSGTQSRLDSYPRPAQNLVPTGPCDDWHLPGPSSVSRADMTDEDYYALM